MEPPLSHRQVSKLTSRVAHCLFPKFPTQLEAEFRQRYNASNAPAAWFGLLLGTGVYLAFYFWDRVVDYPHSTQTLIVRGVLCSWFLAVALINRPTFARHLQLLMAPTIALAGVGVAVIISVITDGLIFGLSGIVLVLMFTFGFLRLLFVPSLLAALVTCFAYNVAAIVNHLPLSLLIANNFFLVSAIVSGASVTYLFERLFRAQFLAERQLAAERETLARQHQMDNRYLEWLRGLATFLRHEVRTPVAQINSGIELIQLVHDRNDRIRQYTTSALLATQQVWNLVERASRATDAEAFVRQAVLQFFDLRTSLTELVEAFRQTHSGIDIYCDACAHVWVYADPTLVKEAVDNLLVNAASFALDGSAIQILFRSGYHARGDQSSQRWTPDSRRCRSSLYALYVEPIGPSSEHHGLGLYLVRLIAEQHGGTAAIANLDDRSGVEACITLPLARYGSSSQR